MTLPLERMDGKTEAILGSASEISFEGKTDAAASRGNHLRTGRKFIWVCDGAWPATMRITCPGPELNG
jgi:hypothetical protein